MKYGMMHLIYFMTTNVFEYYITKFKSQVKSVAIFKAKYNCTQDTKRDYNEDHCLQTEIYLCEGD